MMAIDTMINVRSRLVTNKALSKNWLFSYETLWLYSSPYEPFLLFYSQIRRHQNTRTHLENISTRHKYK